MNKSQDWPFAHGAPAREKNGSSYASFATPVRGHGYNPRRSCEKWLTRPRVVTSISGEYARYLPECTLTPVIPDFEGPIEQPDPYQFGLVGDGFHDDREPLQGDEYVKLVHRWNVLLAVAVIVIAACLFLVGGK